MITTLSRKNAFNFVWPRDLCPTQLEINWKFGHSTIEEECFHFYSSSLSIQVRVSLFLSLRGCCVVGSRSVSLDLRRNRSRVRSSTRPPRRAPLHLASYTRFLGFYRISLSNIKFIARDNLFCSIYFVGRINTILLN